MDKIPSFDSLPLHKDDPPYSAWGLYGSDDQLGFLNRLIPDVVVAAAKEIRTGIRVSVNWPLDAQKTPGFNRPPFEQSIIAKHPRLVNDDVWTFNTQSSSQWDGFRHYGYQTARRFYNGVTMEEVHAASAEGADGDGNASPSDRLPGVNGIHFVAERGIVGRGILLDHAAWREHILQQAGQDEGLRARLAAFNTFDSSPITLADLRSVAAHQGTTIHPADILLVRSGFVRDYGRKTEAERAESNRRQPYPACGLERGEHMLRWIWENFAAVAGDQPAFEVCPLSSSATTGGGGDGGSDMHKLVLHEVLLGGWGCPIGELFDLEELSKECARQGRYEFFFCSEPCNVIGGVASPPNALAIF